MLLLRCCQTAVPFSVAFRSSDLQPHMSLLVCNRPSSAWPSYRSLPTSYNLRQIDSDVIDIGLHRALAVTAGILWAAFVSRFWWPAEARRELSKSLSELSHDSLDLSLVYY